MHNDTPTYFTMNTVYLQEGAGGVLKKIEDNNAAEKASHHWEKVEKCTCSALKDQQM